MSGPSLNDWPIDVQILGHREHFPLSPDIANRTGSWLA
jgi:hypothetical protein